MSDSWVLPKPKWSEFVDRNWEKQPKVYRNVFPKPIVSSDEVFELLGRFGREVAQGKHGSVRAWIKDRRVDVRKAEVFPKDGDRDMAGYERRLASEDGGQPFAVIANNLQATNFELWLRMRRFISGLTDLIGIPGAEVDFDLVLGRYPFTPHLGIHQDTASVFSFIVHGEKNLYVWPDSAIERGKPKPDPEAHARDRTVLSGGPGDLFYWPSSYWHIGKSEGGISVALGLSLYMKEDLAKHLARWMERLVRIRLADAASVDMHSPESFKDRAAPDCLESMLEKTREAAESPELRVSMLCYWLNRLSAGGFALVPAPEPDVRVSEKDRFRRRPECPLLHTVVGEHLIYSANGISSVAKASDGAADLIRRIEAGTEINMSELLPRSAAQKSQLLEIARNLLSCRALERTR